MPVADRYPAAFRRGLAALADGSGRTLVIAGPPFSGKTALLRELRARLTAQGARISELKGSRRDREAAFSLVAPLDEETIDGPVPPAASDEEETQEPVVPIAALGTFGEETGRSRRARGERQRGRILGVSYAVRGRGLTERDPAERWNRWVAEFREAPTLRRAVLVDDGAFADPESREYLQYVVEHARFRPVLLVLVLDSEDPSYSSWEEKLLGRGDVDWVRRSMPLEDPRETSRLTDAVAALPPASRRLVALTALLGGPASEVALSRVSRLAVRELADAILPAMEAKLLKVEEGRVSLAHGGWVDSLPKLLGPAAVREMHREIAEGLEALYPEPTLDRRIELARHYFAWEPGTLALRYLLEAAELSERLTAHDTAVELLDSALECVPSLPAAERPHAEVELRLLRARALLYSGRATEAEPDIHEAVTRAIDRQVPPELLEDWLEPLVPVLMAVGPRASLATEVAELADRCEAAERLSAALMLLAVRIGFDVERGRSAEAREDSRAAGHAARRVERGPAQAVALIAIAAARLDGPEAERALMERFLDQAESLLAGTRRTGIQQLGEVVRARLLAQRGEVAEALEVSRRGIGVLQRLRLAPIELFHQLGIAAILLEAPPDERVPRVLRRARELIDQMHLSPPAAGLFEFWFQEGRHLARLGETSNARDRFSAIADRPPASVPPAFYYEACLRLARLELEDGREPEARRYFDRAAATPLGERAHLEWAEWSRTVADRSVTGGEAAERATSRSPAGSRGRGRRRS